MTHDELCPHEGVVPAPDCACCAALGLARRVSYNRGWEDGFEEGVTADGVAGA